MNSTMLSRSGSTNGDGKLTCRLDIPMSEDMEAAVIALATLNGMTKAEWSRLQLDRVINGELAMVRRMAQQGTAWQSEDSGRKVG